MNVDVADDHEQLNRAMNSPSPVFMVGPNKSTTVRFKLHLG